MIFSASDITRVRPAWCLSAAIALAAASAWAAPVHVSPAGRDDNPGTRERPVAGLQRAVDLVAGRDGAQEIILAAGVYRGAVSIPARADPPPLLIRAARDSRGAFVDAIIDGSRPIDRAEPVPGRPGVARVGLRSPGPEGGRPDSHSMWEEDTGVRYLAMADEPAVEQVPASFAIGGGSIHFRTSDGRPAAEHRIAMSRDHLGIQVNRSHVTLQGLQFRHFILRRRSAAVVVNAADVNIEDCRVWNAAVAFFSGDWTNALARGQLSGTTERGARIVRCRADAVSAGYLGLGGLAIIEDCQFFYRPGPFQVPDYSQDQSGIQSYHPAGGAEARRNLVVGFNLGLFFKSNGTHYIAERNTLVGFGGASHGMGQTNPSAVAIYRDNVVTGFRTPMFGLDALPASAVIEGNLFWSGARPELRGPESRLTACNRFAAPQFVAPERDDYRLDDRGGAGDAALSGADLRPEGGAGSGFAIPPVTGARLGGTAFDRAALLGHRSIAPARIPHAGPPRSWHVDPVSGADDPAAGTAQRPFRSLQLALNHAAAGDRVVLQAGYYFGPHVLDHGGTAQAPITIEAAGGRAVLDGARAFPDRSILTLHHAPHVIVRGLEVRWHTSMQLGGDSAGLHIESSPGVQVIDCEVWNGRWSDHPFHGIGIRAVDSPGIVIENCLVYAVDIGLQLQRSPRFRIVHNIVAMTLRTAARFMNSVAGSELRHNSFAFSGGGDIVWVTGAPDEMARFTSDYNNLATYIRDVVSPRRPAPEDDIKPVAADFFRHKISKAVGNWNGERYYSLEEWRAATGRDRHSIFVHPRYRDPENRDFTLMPNSPNRAAGAEGAIIGRVANDAARRSSAPPQAEAAHPR